jgi:hypothetical protein
MIVPVLSVVGATNNNDILSRSSIRYHPSELRTKEGSSKTSLWLEIAKLNNSNGTMDDYFGLSVSISGDFGIVGVPGYNEKTGTAYVFKRSGTTWIQDAKLNASDGSMNEYFGYSVSISGDSAIIGAPNDNSLTGSAYVFTRTGTIWVQEAKLLASDGAPGDWFGDSVSINGDAAIVGAPGDNIFLGSAYVFERTGSVWAQEARLNASDGALYDWLGFSVSISGDSAVVGAPFQTSSTGASYIFTRSGTTWMLQQKLTASDGASYDLFGDSVSMDGDSVIIGAYGDDTSAGVNAGSAYLFTRTGTTWTEDAKVTASEGVAGEQFGYAVSINGNRAIIGTYQVYQDDIGSAYIFKNLGTTWYEEAKLCASDGKLHDYFGWSVSINDTSALIGAPGDDYNIGIENIGSAYVFGQPTPDLDGKGSLIWTDVKANAKVTGMFQVGNIGQPGSLLNWSVTSYPNWGTWTFSPSSGTGLAAGSWINVTATCVAPDKKNTQFTGNIIISNTENLTDNCIIPISLKTPVCKDYQFHLFFEGFLKRFPIIFSVLRNIFGY